MSGYPKHRASDLYVRILGCIARTPLTAGEIAAELGVGACSVFPVLRMLRGICCHIVAYRPGGRGGTPALWGFGLGVEPEPMPSMQRRVSPKKRAELVAFVSLARCMMDEPMSCRQLVEETGISRTTVAKILNLAKAEGIAYVAEWDRERACGAYAPHWMLGAGQQDARKPKALPRHEVHRRYWSGRTAKRRQSAISMAMASNQARFSEAA